MKKKKEYLEISIPMVPKFTGKKLRPGTGSSDQKDPLNLKDLKVGRLRGNLRLIDGQRNRERTSRQYRKRYQEGDNAAVIELLERDPRFMKERWVKEAWLRRSSKRGNKWGNTRIERMVILGLVDSLSEDGMSREEAFIWLSERVGLTYERIKALYYDSRRVSTYQPLVFPCDPLVETETPKDLESFVAIEEAFGGGEIYALEILVREYLSNGGDPRNVEAIVSTYMREGRRLLELAEVSAGGETHKLSKGHKKELLKQLGLAEHFRFREGGNT